MANDTKDAVKQDGAQMRITPDEILTIKKAFKGNEPLVRLLRKIFLPEIDPAAPIGQIIDLWMTVDVKDMTPEMALINIKARNALITHVDQQLLTLKLISEIPDMTPEEIQEKVSKNSNK